jgi:hypothetical protein
MLLEGHAVTKDPLMSIYKQWVHPCYLQLLHGNFRGLCLAEESSPEQDELIRWFRRALTEITPDVIDTLLEQTEWRARLTASWFCGLKGWRQFRESLGQSLVESKVCFAGQGYCMALACFADRASADYLCAYLDRWLPQLDKYYDQHWAMPALQRIDVQLRTNFASRYLGADGLWEQWALGCQDRTSPASLEDLDRHFNLLRRCGSEFFGSGMGLTEGWPSAVSDLAQALYDGQGNRLILADALEEAGHDDLARHFRQEEWHPRGCWSLDAILGKS